MRDIEVVAAILIQDKRVFCAQRSNKGENASKWEFPGGKIETGESLEVALKREIQEELGVGIAVGNYLMTTHYQSNEFSLTMHVFWGTIIAGSIILNEHDAACWLTPDELDPLDWAPADLPVVKRVKETLGCLSK